MDTEMMIRNLKKVEEDHKDDKVFTGQLNIAEMAHDARKLDFFAGNGVTVNIVRKVEEMLNGNRFN